MDENQLIVIDMLNIVDRDGISDIIDYLKYTDYFTAPASTRYHRSYTGGLCAHSINVTKMFAERNELTGQMISDDSVVICGILHDLCKVGYYYKNNDYFCNVKGHPAERSHARLSIEIIENFIELKPAEKEIILYHMGLFGCYGKIIEYTPDQLHSAISRNPLVQIFAACDMEESRWIE